MPSKQALLCLKDEQSQELYVIRVQQYSGAEGTDYTTAARGQLVFVTRCSGQLCATETA
jgi:hypothetical protein